MNQWSQKSKQNLKTCHTDLIILANHVLPIHDCSVICGHRNQLEQNKAYRSGNSTLQWPNGKHNVFPSQAIDLAPYIPGYNVTYNREHTLYFAGIVLGVGKMLYDMRKMKYRIRWGGDWDSDNNFKEHKFYDGIHFELIMK